jgi:pyruvate/2-oxoglutarate dehydrogenase complex dihydrolipoamide dehydrogenase (E3) component
MVKVLNRVVKFELPRIFCHMKRFDFDVAIIGGGSAGYAAARTVAGAGLKTAVIEGGAEVGGLCILRGCMPTKALLYAAEVKHLAERAGTWGVRAGKVGFDFKKVMARKDALIKDFADYRVQQLSGKKFEFIRANARFLDAHTVALLAPHPGPLPARSSRGEGDESEAMLKHSFSPPKRGEGGRRPDEGNFVTAKHFVIATGSVVAPSPLPQLNETGFITSDDALALTKLPKSLIVLGGGAVACEFAQFFARFGVKVTLIQRSEHILKEFDGDAGAEIEKVFRREGIRVFTGTKLLDAKRKGKLKTISFEHEGKPVSVSAEEILFALGRVPNTASLGLENAGVKLEQGRIVADEFMRTSAPHIYAAGDGTGPHEIVHLAVQQGEIAARNIAAQERGRPARDNFALGASNLKLAGEPPALRSMDYRLLISIVFTEPQAAFVGLTGKQAAAQKIPFLAASYPFNDHGKSLIMEAKDGFVKLLADPKSGEILGGCCVGPVGGELLHEIVAAMAKRMSVHELAAMPHYHPTLAEIWTYPAEELAERISPP